MKLLNAILTSATISAAATAAFAADTYTIDPAHVWLTFSVNHGGWSSAQGVFGNVEGTIVLDKDDATKSSVEATINAASVNTNFEQRDADLNSPDFLNTAEFPVITFKSTAIEKTGEKTGTMTGDLTMIGATVPVTLDVVWSGLEASYPWAPETLRTGFTATGVINPEDFGMVKVKENGLGPEIQVTINVEGEKK